MLLIQSTSPITRGHRRVILRGPRQFDQPARGLGRPALSPRSLEALGDTPQVHEWEIEGVDHAAKATDRISRMSRCLNSEYPEDSSTFRALSSFARASQSLTRD
jgi:hypothetical protein